MTRFIGMSRIMLVCIGLVVLPSLALAQTPPVQITNDDLLRLIGMQQVQVLQCGKQLEAAQQKVAELTPKPMPTQEKK